MFQVVQAPEVPNYRRGGRACKYPFHELNVGEMFFIPNRSSNTMMSLASKTGRKLGRKFETRLIWMCMRQELWTLCAAGAPGAVQGVGVYRTK